MKSFTLALALPIVLTTACGQSSVSAVDSASTSAKHVYSVDHRAVDGDLQVLTLSAQGGAYTASLRTAYVDRATGKSVDQTQNLGEGLACAFTVASFDCSRDLRPVDGALVDLKGVLVDATYAVTLRSAYIDRIAGKSVDTTATIASGLQAQ